MPLLLLCFFLYRRWRRLALKRIGESRLVKALISAHSPTKSIVRFWLLFLAFTLGVVAVANPRVRDAGDNEQRKGIDLVLALDVSNSMLAADLPPNRLSRAKLFMNKLIDQLKDDRLALVLFAGKSYVQMPLTFDQGAARMYISSSGPGTVNVQGTSIAEALVKSSDAFGEDNDRFKSVVLITDGETHDEEALEEAKELAQSGIMVNTIGIGSVEGAVIEDTATKSPRKDEAGQVVVSKLNEPLLKEVASTTNGVYVHLENTDAAVQQVMAQFANIEKKALGDASLFSYKSYYFWLLIPMLLLLLTEVLMGDRKKVKA